MFCITAKTENEGLQNHTNLLHPTLIKRKLIVASLRISQATANASPGYHKERERERETRHALSSNHFQPCWQQSWGSLSLHRRLLADGGALPLLSHPSECHPPNPLCPETVLWMGVPIPEPSVGSQRPSGAPLPSLGLADASWKSSGKYVPPPPPKSQAPPPPQAAQPRGKDRRRGLWRCPGEPGQGGGVSVGRASHEKLMPPCRLLIFVCFSLFASREGSFISPDCHYPALNFHRAGGRPGKGRQAGLRGGGKLGAPWAEPAGG